MKKTYIKPISEAIALPDLMQTLPVSGGSGSSTSGDSGGWSNKFWGNVEDDEEEKDFDWD
ncbi:MAG: hypothetical protein J6129_03135 [Bacteroidaceae bacterium]|nr:hypothetical protein [Bacteroidaceae bacterium]